VRAPGVWGGVVAALALGYALLAGHFVRQPGLGTFADDSVSYLVMAQMFTPWREVSAAVASVFAHEAFHPPLYPLLLAISGAAHDFPLAHSLSALLLAACLPVLYALGARWLGDRRAAAAAVLAIVLLPAIWIHARGILSEPLFCLLLFAMLWTIDAPWGQRARLNALALLLAALVLTRTVGLPVALAYGAWAVCVRGTTPRSRLAEAMPVLFALAAYAAWILARPAVPDTNAGLALDRLAVLRASAEPWSAFAAGVARQAMAMAEAWAGSLLLFWVEGQAARPALAGLVGMLALAGLAWRFVAGKADAWMVGAYLLVYLLWPFYDQMTRFLFPVLPVLVLYAFFVPAALFARLQRPRSHARAALVLALAVASLAAPGLAFMHQRFGMREPYTGIIDWYRTPDLAAARARARVHLELAADMEAIRALSRPEEQVMWVAPAYIALLAGRRALPAPPAHLPFREYRAAVERAAPDLVFMSTFHPRDTVRDAAWQAASSALAGTGRVVHRRQRPDAAAPSSILLRLHEPPERTRAGGGRAGAS
jgi:hypothetical protein